MKLLALPIINNESALFLSIAHAVNIQEQQIWTRHAVLQTFMSPFYAPVNSDRHKCHFPHIIAVLHTK